MKNEFYFTLSLTENEHYIVERMIRDESEIRGYEVVYYRKFKEGHIPMLRECKIKAPRHRVEKMLKDLGITGWTNHNKKTDSGRRLYETNWRLD